MCVHRGEVLRWERLASNSAARRRQGRGKRQGQKYLLLQYLHEEVNGSAIRHEDADVELGGCLLSVGWRGWVVVGVGGGEETRRDLRAPHCTCYAISL